ncbi:phage gp6-like head-tail connector protein [Streptomyces althioticus]|uniref:Phage gp6-like head-tail connector protein n=1 Tax=Streptomyces althioticus TaxID=83380 RepID=A0ABZ1YB75_9ACTN
MAFVTVEEVATRLGWPLTPEEQARVNAFIQDCTVLIEDYCGKDFERREDQSFSLPVKGGWYLEIPPRYTAFLTVDSVALVDGTPVEGWRLNGSCLVLEEGWPESGYVTVTGSWGYPVPPAALKVATAAEVIRWMAQTPGLAMERTGEREVELDTSSKPQSLSAAACQALRRYRPSAGTVTLRREGP